jgi:superfamily I DNA and/or RNA helicase
VKSITVETVDKMQGLEFDIVYLSMTRSTKLFEKKSKNGVKNRFGFSDDQHRICVALTRQKRCLIVCGDKEMLKDKDAEEKIPSLVRFYELCKGGERQVAVI